MGVKCLHKQIIKVINMQYYLIDIKDIGTCSKNGIVACWSETYNCPVVVVDSVTSVIFGDKEIVEIGELK